MVRHSENVDRLQVGVGFTEEAALALENCVLSRTGSTKKGTEAWKSKTTESQKFNKLENKCIGHFNFYNTYIFVLSKLLTQ